MSTNGRTVPLTFYLNEQHELARTEKEGGGRIPPYIGINWASKGTAISKSLQRVRKEIQASPDPVKENHYFLLAAPVEQLTKASKDKRKAKDGKVFENTDFAREHSRVFRRLGVDLINVAEDGSAIVHMNPEMMEQLSGRAQSLPRLGAGEQSRWATIDRFEMIPPELRIDSDWLRTLHAKKVTDAVIEFQSLLTRSEINALVRAVVQILLRNLGESVTGTGTDFSGRQWVRGKITPESLTKISQGFTSVQSLHSPLISTAASPAPSKHRGHANYDSEVDTSSLPVIGVLDTGVPTDHAILGKYRRGTYLAPTSPAGRAHPHGCFVSSRAVFGDSDYSAGPPAQTPIGSARYYDINISGIRPGEIEDKGIYPALQAIVATAPDVRVFNMSFDSPPLESITPVKQFETLSLVQDLDNFIFQNDIVVVVAAGNSEKRIPPSTPYPGHFNDPRWALGAWARSFNSLTCGSFVERIGPGGLVTEAGWPSSFCRIGPGLCESPKPDFSANGGNSTPQYDYAAGLGVWGLTPEGMWEDWTGTSFAAPILAREAVFALQKLQKVCERGAQPFAVTVKAFLALTATPAVDDDAVKELSERTLGRGSASADRLDAASARTGVMIWQGVLEDEKDIARIQVPIPAAWWRESHAPHLRVILAWDPPVNAAVKHLWATRRVTARLKMHPDSPRAQYPLRSLRHESYPVLERLYNLRKLPRDAKVEGDFWLIEIEYERIAEYHPAMTFPPQQRVAFAAELLDKGTKKLSPQAALQALPASKTMTRLTVPPSVARLPIVLKTPV